jgi:NAD(P)-dependent dehydrogenase (short-subunit alcohol dehydrogenase family)
VKRLENRIAVVTGAGSGMGRAVAVRFAEEGAHVYAVDLRAEAAEETAGLVTKAGGSAAARQLDVTDLGALRALVDEIERDHGVLHVLHNHAGTPGAGGFDASLEDYAETMDVNAKSAYYLTSYALDLLKKADGKGSVIFTSSISGLVGSPYSPLYSLAKGGIVVMMKAMALALARDGVRFNAICPAAVATPMLRVFFDRENTGITQERIDELAEQTVPLGRAADPREIANAVLFLASDEASFITGVALPVDGGYTAR